jgi:Holliday junction resolvasome RuvABC DNA-binding subunit
VLIALITGRLVQKEPTLTIIDVGGVGYELDHTCYDVTMNSMSLAARSHCRVHARARGHAAISSVFALSSRSDSLYF